MSKKKKKKAPTANDLLKYEIASELGLSSKVDELGWGGLTAAETGKIGGLLSAKRKKINKDKADKSQNNIIS